jgi:autotransporter-associated beta strand protein
LSYGGIIAGGGAFTKAGAGTLILSGTNTYTGITTISGGTLSIDDDIRLGAPPVSATAGRLMFGGGTLGTTATFTLNANRGIGFSSGNIAINTAAGTTLTYGGVMASGNTGSTLVKTGTGRLTLSGANTNLGGTTISEGTIQLGASNVIPDRGLTVNGTLDLNGFNETVRSLSGSGLITTSVAGSVTFTPGVSGYGVSTTFSGIIEDGNGTMNLTVNGANGLFLTLTGDNTYTGITSLIGGNLVIDADNRMGPPPANVVANKLILDGGTLVTTATFTLHENRGITMGNSAGTINTSPGTTLTYQGIISGGTGSFIKEGTGTLILSGANTYTGATTIANSGGTLKLGTSGAIPDASALTVGNSSTFDLAGFSETVGSLAGGGTVTSSAAGTLTLTTGGNNTSTTFSGILQNGSATSVALTKNGSGTLTLSGANTYTGITTISGGEISINADTRLGTAPVSATQGHLLLDGGTLHTVATFTLSANRGITLGSSGGTISIYTGGITRTLTYGGIIDGPGALTKAGQLTGNGILILSGVNSYLGATTVSAGTLRLGAAGVIPDASALTVGSSTTFDLAGFSETVGSLAGAGTVTSSAAGTPTLTAGDDNTSTTFSGTIQNGSATSVALTKNGTGTLTLTGANTYTGETSISAGTLSIGAGSTTGAISNSSNVTNNAALIVNRSNAYTYSGVISGTGSLTKQGAGTFTISGANTYTGATTISVGTLQLSTASERISNSSALTVAGGATFDLAGFSETVGSLAGAGTVSSSAAGTPTLTAGGDNTSTTFSGIMQNGSATSVGLTKNGTGTLTLTGTNTYSGSTTINGGTLSIGDGGTTGIVPGNITNDAALIFNRSNSLTYSGVISGIGTVAKQGNGMLTLTGANTYTGSTTISDGTLSIGDGSTSGAISNSSNVTNNAALIVNRSDAYAYSGVISGTGSLTKQGAGTFTISGANTYTGATTISVGTLQLSTANERISNSSALTVAGGATFDLAGFSETVGSLAGAGTVSSSAAGTPTLTAGGDNTSTTFSGIMQNGSATSVDLTKNGTGTLTLTGANTYTGTTTISAGTLSIGDGGTTGLVAGNITNDATLIFNRSNSLTFSGVISGIGAVTKQGNGTLTLTGANSYTGETSISAGTLRLGDNEVIPDASDVVLTGMLDMNGFNETINGINFDGPSILVVLNASNITVNGAVTGAGSGSYFQTNGTGSVKRTVTNGETFSFPVGNSAYNPLSITNNTGTAEWFSARVRDEVYEYGTFGEVLTQPRVKRTWDIDKETPNASAGGGVDFVFNWNSGEVSNPAPATYALFHHDANGNGWAEVVIGTGSQNGNSLSFSGYKGTFSPFGIGDPADPLPVELLYFNGTCQPQGLDFRWATAAEVNSKSFTLEHSANLVEWHALHTQPSAGFSSSQKDYSTQLPHQPHLGPYFRLHQEDFDGKFERFAPLHLECSETSGSGLFLYPNPAHDAVWISGIAGTLDWEIFDARGRRLRSGKLNMDETPQQLPTQGLPAGMYLFQTPNARLPLMLQD